MKILRNISALAFAAIVASSTVSCIDDIKFGNAFLEKAPGGTETEDTIFGNAEYTRRFLNNIYAQQNYVLPGLVRQNWGGMSCALTDCWQEHFKSIGGIMNFYNGTLTSANCESKYSSPFPYAPSSTDSNVYTVWQTVWACWKLLERIDNVPDISESDKKQWKAEAKCLIATRYLDAFRWYGGLPLLKGTFTGAEGTYEIPRATVEETVDFMVNLLDEAAADLPWNFSDLDAQNETGRWTKAGAMALKCRILVFAASPLLNADQPYNTETDATAEQQLTWWYGNYDKARWDRALQACEEFFSALNSNGYYQLVQADGTRPEDYRLAFRRAYYNQDSKEVLHSVRYGKTAKSCAWHYYGPKFGGVKKPKNNNGRRFCPTQEYVEMFPWADGTPFNWDESEAQQNAGTGDKMLDKMFATYTFSGKSVTPSTTNLTRDPRLYESVLVNGIPFSLDWSTGNMSGNYHEMWVGGTDISKQNVTITNGCATGYGNNKYWLNEDYYDRPCQWTVIRLSDVYLLYAEALIQSSGNLTKAIEQIDKVRARVGLKGLAESNPDKKLTTDKDALLDELLRERACELGVEDNRWFDIVRYKLGDKLLLKQLHGLRIYRLDDSGNRVESKWRGDKKTQMPTHFDYEKFEITVQNRYWWGLSKFETKWYLLPLPMEEINKGYGCIQNPGW